MSIGASDHSPDCSLTSLVDCVPDSSRARNARRFARRIPRRIAHCCHSSTAVSIVRAPYCTSVVTSDHKSDCSNELLAFPSVRVPYCSVIPLIEVLRYVRVHVTRNRGLLLPPISMRHGRHPTCRRSSVLHRSPRLSRHCAPIVSHGFSLKPSLLLSCLLKASKSWIQACLRAVLLITFQSGLAHREQLGGIQKFSSHHHTGDTALRAEERKDRIHSASCRLG